MIDLRFIGTGGAHDVAYGNSAAVVKMGNKNILIDCGYSVYGRLMELDIVHELDGVLVTHLHDDHVGSLSCLLYHRYFKTPDRRLQLLFPDSFGNTLLTWLSFAMLTPEKFCVPTPLSEFPGIEEIDTTGRHFEGMPSYAYILRDADDCVVFSGDLHDTDYLFNQLEAHRCKPRLVLHDISFFETPVHAHYLKVAQYLNQYRIVGYHHNPTFNPPDNPIPLAYHTPEVLYGLQLPIIES